MKKILRVFSSMRLALILLSLIVLACVLGGIIPQGALLHDYRNIFGETLSQVILFAGLDRVFTAWWFILLVGLLLINLFLCSLIRFPSTLKLYNEGFNLNNCLLQKKPSFELQLSSGKARDLLKQLGFKNPISQAVNGEQYLYQSRNRLGVWGSWLSHLGMLIIVVGFALGQLLHVDTSVYGVPGQTKQVQGHDLAVQIDAFEIILRDDHTVEQYIADLTIHNLKDNTSVKGQSKVNNPLQAYGMSFLQNATGWAVNVSSFRGEELLDERIVCAGESVELKAINEDYMDLALVVHALYPDMIMTPTGPKTASPYLNNPAVLFSLYYQGKLVDQNLAGIGHDIKVADYRFTLTSPQPYTLIQIVSDPTLPLVMIGGVIMLIGLFLAFYLRPQQVWVRYEEDCERVYGYTKKGADLFSDKAVMLMKEMNTTT
ncbi:MAG: cytochrome c biogenesis protein ResB [Christensenellaceae bacterium]|nr:cytochrome c biogenesis protein ResB [Christensenellaceae bacterium]